MTSSLFPKSPRLKEFRRARSWKCLSASRVSAPTDPTDTLIEASNWFAWICFRGILRGDFSIEKPIRPNRKSLPNIPKTVPDSLVFTGHGFDGSIDRRWKLEPSLWVNRHLNTSLRELSHLNFAAYSISMAQRSLTKFPYLSKKSIPFSVCAATFVNWS